MTETLPGHAAAPDFERRAAACRDRLTGVPGGARSDDAWLFARLVAAREVRGELALLGLSAQALAELAQRHFAADAAAVLSPSPHVEPHLPHQPPVVDATHAAFVASMRDFLVGLAAPDVDAADARCLATILAHACLRPDHLWRDLGLSGRDAVSAMLTRYFPALVARNTANLRWKKFLARDLALARGDEPAPAPGCPGCEDYRQCFPGDGGPPA